MSLLPLDNNVPFLTSNNVPIQWNKGPDAFAMATSLSLRLNTRGITLYPDHWKMRDLTKLQWLAIPCTISTAHGSLCRTVYGEAFPSTKAPHIDPLLSTQQFVFKDFDCNQDDTGQMLNYSSVYDLSACNVFNQKSDWVFYLDTLFVKNTILSEWEYILLCCLCIYSLRTFSHMIAHDKDHDQDLLYMMTVFVCISLSLFICMLAGSALYVTLEDYLAFWFLITVICFDIFLFCLKYSAAFKHAKTQYTLWNPSYNAILTSFLLVSIRLYHGIRTPYNPFLLWAITTRLFVKCFSYIKQVSLCMLLSNFLDTFLVSFLIVIGTPYSYSVCLCIIYIAYVTAKVITDWKNIFNNNQ